MRTKKCYVCFEEKPISSFNPHSCCKDGYRGICKNCRNIRRRLRYATDPSYKESRIQAGKRSLMVPTNLEKRRAYARNYYTNNRENYREAGRRWWKDNPEKAKAKNARNRSAKKDKPMYRLNNAIHVGISASLSGRKNGRKWQRLVGYNLEELREHLESQFIDSMTWDNYGKWHVDHIIPQSFFVFGSPDDTEFKMCWRLENLQPLWARDNISKSNKINKVA